MAGGVIIKARHQKKAERNGVGMAYQSANENGVAISGEENSLLCRCLHQRRRRNRNGS